MSTTPAAPHGRTATMRTLVVPVYAPAVVFGIGQGAALPVVALAATELGASTTVAALVAASTGAGLLVGDLPAGRIVSRFGERRAILGGSLAGALGVLLALLAWDVWSLALGVLVSGCAMSVWTLARQRYLAEAVPAVIRARAMSLFATMWRTGALAGPFVGAAVISHTGTRGAFAVQLVAVVVSGWLMSRLPDDGTRRERGAPPQALPGGRRATLVGVALTHRRLFLTLGVGTLLLGAARTSRDVVVPLWGHHIGLDAAEISLVLGCAGVLEVLVSVPAGHLMDRFGRSVIAVPSLALLATAYVTLPLSTTALGLWVVVAVLGLGNGLSNGLLMTIGADVAPAAYRTEFLASWRLMHDSGMFSGPLVVSVVSAASLAAASLTVGALAGAGALVMWRAIPRYVPHPRTDDCPGGRPDARPDGRPDGVEQAAARTAAPAPAPHPPRSGAPVHAQLLPPDQNLQEVRR